MTFAIVASLFGSFQLEPTEVRADDAFETSIKGFPDSYKPYLRTLHTKYPKWKFVPYNTGLNFATVVSKQAANDKSLIENAYNSLLKSNASSDYNTSTGKYIAKDGGSWVTASSNCIAYFVDPRNFLNEKNIYMFEQLSYDAKNQTQDGVEAILQGSFMYKTNMAFINTSGKYKTTQILYSKKIMEAASTTKVSAYYIAARMLQEIGAKKNSKYAGMGASGSVCGEYSSAYTGIYNFYNIGAYTSSNPIANGLSWAKSGTTYQRPWTTPGKSIIGGAEYIGEKYINCGQNTTYFQRFNVRKDSTYSLYTHQYMTNIYGAANEGAYTAEAYDSLGIAGTAKTFIIPVYNNMPSKTNEVSLGVSGNKTATVSSSVNMRKGAGTEYDTVITLSKGDKVTVSKGVMTTVKFGVKWLNNPYWYKVSITKSGKKYSGYIAANYLSFTKEYNVIKGNKLKLPVVLKSSETVYYRSDNPAIATVDSTGNVTGKAAGTVVIRAFTANGSMGTCAVQVYNTGCILTPESYTLNLGSTKKLTATVYPTSETNKKVTYKSSNTKVATVSSTGKVKGVGQGTVTITAIPEVGGAYGFAKITVIKPVTSIGLDKAKSILKVGENQKLKATIAPADASIKNITWTSSNSSVVTVSGDGTVTAKAPGKATITAKSHNGKTAVCEYTIKPATVVASGKSKNYNSVKLSWKQTGDLTGYIVYRKNGSGKFVKIGNASATAKSFVDTNLVTGHAYAYKVRAYRTVSGVNYISNYSAEIIVTPKPARVKGLSVISEGTGAQLKWNAVAGASGYRIYRSQTKNGTYKRLKTIGSSTTLKYSNLKLTKGKTYYYKVTAYRKVSGKKIEGLYSKTKSIKK